MNKQEVLDLLARYASGNCTQKELQLLEDWYAQRLEQNAWSWESEEEKAFVHDTLQQRLQNRLYPDPKPKVRKLWYRVAAAGILLVAAFWGYRLWSDQAMNQEEQFYISAAVAPGSQAAQLTLEDGSTLRIDEMKIGEVYQGQGVLIKKLASGELVYEVDEKALANQKSAGLNTISIPRGAQYQFTLPDGSKVWLNSASSITYPVAFIGDERIVSLSGEAYFEIEENPSMPFRVKAQHTDVVVTGTRFNVSAFGSHQQVKITLASGGVRIEKDEQQVALRPGQQSLTASGASGIKVREVDVDEALAWVEGQFLFEDQTIQAIMEDVARWYNVDVEYQGSAYQKRFGGTYSRDKSLNDLLKHLESLSTIRFKVEERRVTVMM
jgi:transmembrane sensor